MKVLAVILSLLIVVLSSFPCCQDDDLCPDSTSLAHTKEHCAHDDVPHDDDSHKNQSPCSPFYNCGRCSAFTISLSSIDFVAYEPNTIWPNIYGKPQWPTVYWYLCASRWVCSKWWSENQALAKTRLNGMKLTKKSIYAKLNLIECLIIICESA